jgi:hypothetical protein
MYDAIVIGARSAGASTAMLLARTGYRVLLVDRATFLSDSPTGHYIHRMTVGTIFHPAGTAKMGPGNDPGAVVDQECRVRGIEGLRVVDASVMPTIPRANTNLTCIMIGERVADWMREA